MLIRPDRKVGSSIHIGNNIAKNGRGRRLPIHPELKSALMQLHMSQGRPWTGPVIRSQRGSYIAHGQS
jgi:integrase/recombinase XerD